MSRQKQIKDIAKDCANIEHQNFLDYWEWVRFSGKKPLPYDEYIATKLYEAGYRKQKKGEWISVESDVIFKCSLCEAEISTSWDYENEDMFSFCPCCGAKMKGGAEQ